MAWETRFGRQYYYRGRRMNGRIEKVYLGAGSVAVRAAEKDAAAKARRAAEKAELAALEGRLAGVDQLGVEVHRGTDMLAEAMLLALGFREHHGQWRKKRNGRRA